MKILINKFSILYYLIGFVLLVSKCFSHGGNNDTSASQNHDKATNNQSTLSVAEVIDLSKSIEQLALKLELPTAAEYASGKEYCPRLMFLNNSSEITFSLDTKRFEDSLSFHMYVYGDEQGSEGRLLSHIGYKHGNNKHGSEKVLAGRERLEIDSCFFGKQFIRMLEQAYSTYPNGIKRMKIRLKLRDFVFIDD
ncbi:MAG: hypothetical protein V2I33_20280, partial [Kangiellaceae bacterium]|nr:hypothetical protein [Kangiellaceae bacterium]